MLKGVTTGDVKGGQVVRKMKDRRRVVFCIPKGYEATEVARLGRSQGLVAHLILV